MRVAIKGKELQKGDTMVAFKRELQIEHITAFKNVAGAYPNRRVATLSNGLPTVLDDDGVYEKVTNSDTQFPRNDGSKKSFDVPQGVKWQGGV